MRRIVVTSEETLADSATPLSQSIIRVSAAAVVQNPWVGQSADNDLQGPAREIAPRIAKLLSDRVIAVCGGSHRIEAFGKGAIIGEAGELEHGAALLHTPFFANLVREFLEGDQVIAFSDDRGAAGTSLVVPLCRKDSGPTRDHFQTVTTRIADAPRHDEIVIVVAASTGRRPFPRSGDRTTDPVVRASEVKGLYS